MRAVRVLIVFSLVWPVAAIAQNCPAELAGARRLMLVTVPDANAPAARLQRFTRTTLQSPWIAEGGPMSALVGRNGVAWGHPFKGAARAGEKIKVEGDKRAPAGFYPIGRPFGFAESNAPDYLRLKSGTVCVDDVRSPAYNTVTTRAKAGAAHGEAMSRVPDYRQGLLVDFPTDAKARGGSCIFIHLWMPDKAGTAGCVAVHEHDMTEVQDFAARPALLAILPAKALDRFRGCLPSL